MIDTYTPSGRCSPAFLATAIGVVAFLAGIGWLYQWLLDLIPFIYVSFILTLGAGFVIWRALGTAVSLGKCRSMALALAVGVLASVVSLAVSHVAAWHSWRGEVEEAFAGEPKETREEILEEATFGAYVEDRVDGGWAIGLRSSFTLSGIFVWLVWLVEAAIFLLGGFIGGALSVAAPFCERCDAWVDGSRGSLITLGADPAQLREQRRATTLEHLLPPVTGGGSGRDAQLVHTVKACRSCGISYLDVEIVNKTVDDKGKAHTDRRDLWSNVLVDDAFCAAFDEIRRARTTPRDRPGRGEAPIPGGGS